MLRIGNLDIQKLSGPVSFHYLVPKKEVFVQKMKEGVFLPLVILLGDKHWSVDERCEESSDEKGTYKLEDGRFSRNLNNLATKYPVDFYVETNGLYSNEIGIIPNFLKRTLGCFNTKARMSKEYDCFFPHIRWHLADIRIFNKNKTEEITIKAIRYLNKLKENTRNEWKEPSPIENYPGVELFRQFFETIITAVQSNYTIDNMAQKMANSIASIIIGNSNSHIYKQLQKYNIDINIELYAYLSILQIYHAYIGKGSVLELLERNNNRSQSIEEMLINLREYIFNGDTINIRLSLDIDAYKTMLETLFNYWIYSTSFFIDLYFLGRMFKTPKNNINSYLTIGLFGIAHLNNISDYLHLSTGWYELKSVSINERLRCISFKDEIDFNKDLEEYAAMRQEYQSIKPFKLRQEQESLLR